jgi:hypothetical protein
MIVAFLRGVTAMGFAVAGLFFFRFWRASLDRLFLLFALAFWILAVDYVVLGVVPLATEWGLSVYTVRLLAFGLILFGIAEKNRR